MNCDDFRYITVRIFFKNLCRNILHQYFVCTSEFLVKFYIVYTCKTRESSIKIHKLE